MISVSRSSGHVGRDHRRGEAGAVLDQRHAVAVEDQAAHRHDRLLAQAVRLGAQPVLVAVDELQARELKREDAEDDDDDEAEVEDLLLRAKRLARSVPLLTSAQSARACGLSCSPSGSRRRLDIGPARRRSWLAATDQGVDAAAG